MNDKKVEQLIHKLGVLLGVDSSELSVSPALSRSGLDAVQPDTIQISESLDIDKLDMNQKLYTHAVLHKLYGAGSKTLTKESIEKLHAEIKTKIPHLNFDKLDK